MTFSCILYSKVRNYSGRVGQGNSLQTKEGSVSGVNPVLTGTGSIEEHHHDRRFSLPQDF
jgi:hypothetical protein